MRQATAAAQQDHSRNGEHEGAGLGGNEIAAQDEDAARFTLGPQVRPRMAGANQHLESDLQVLHVRRSSLVQDHEIDRQSLQMPVLAGAQHLADDAGILDLVDAHHNDRYVAGDALCPEHMLWGQSARDRIGGGAQRRSGIGYVAGQTLIQAGLQRRNVEMAQLHLRLGPGQRGRPLKSVGILMLVDGVEQRLARVRDDRPECDTGKPAGRDPHAPA